MKKIFLLISFFFILVPQVFSHPHNFIDLCIKIEIDAKGITGFWENWSIVREFGKNICVKYDRDNDGTFNAEETDAVKDELFENISKYNYYTYFNIANNTYIPSEVHDFSINMGEASAIFRFFIPCRILTADKDQVC